MAAANVPIPASIPEAAQLIDSFIVSGDGLSVAMFADYDAEYEALYQFGLISDEYLSWTLEYLSARVKTDDPFEAIQLLYPIVYIIGKETRVRRSTLWKLKISLDAIAYSPQALMGDTHLREKAKTILAMIYDYNRDKIVRDC